MTDAEAVTRDQKVSLPTLTAMVIGSMIGSGVFLLPRRFGVETGVAGALIAWAIAGTGMLMLAFVFQRLATRKPDLDAGLFTYAKAGFGDYMGFSSAWGYWISAWIGNVSYMVLLFSTLGYFFPVFGEGNTLPAVICASVLLWLLHFLVLRGIKEAAFINTITTIAKMVPLVLFIVIAAIACGLAAMCYAEFASTVPVAAAFSRVSRNKRKTAGTSAWVSTAGSINMISLPSWQPTACYARQAWQSNRQYPKPKLLGQSCFGRFEPTRHPARSRRRSSSRSSPG